MKRKRCQARKKPENKNFKVYGINSAGIKSKLLSFEAVLKSLQPSIWMLQETKLRSNETIPCESLDEFFVYYLNRQNSQGGGVAKGVKKEFQSSLINEGDDETEAISVKVFVKEFPIRIVVAYGPQENALLEKKHKFWEFIEKEPNQAELEGDALLIQMEIYMLEKI